jgi:hypothetical protein
MSEENKSGQISQSGGVKIETKGSVSAGSIAGRDIISTTETTTKKNTYVFNFGGLALLGGILALLVVGVVLSQSGLLSSVGILQPPDPKATISAVAIERDITLETYLERDKQPIPAGFTCELKSNGMLIKPVVELSGLKGRPVQLGWSIYAADSNRLFYSDSDPYPSRLLSWRPVYTPTSQTDTWVFEHWLPYPQVPGKIFARLELFMQDSSTLKSLGYADTEPVEVVLLPECVGPPPNPPSLQPGDAQSPPL